MKIKCVFQIKTETDLIRVGDHFEVEGQKTYPNIIASNLSMDMLYDDKGAPRALAHSLHIVMAKHMLLSLIRTSPNYGISEGEEFRQVIEWMEKEFTNPEVIVEGSRVSKGDVTDEIF